MYVDCLPDDFNDMSKEETDLAKEQVKLSKDLISKGTKRVMEKVKEIRQSFSKVVISGRRSGSGKIVFEFYDQLVLLWGGSANVSSLAYGIAIDGVEQESHVREQDVLDYSNSPTLSRELINDAASEVEDHEESGASSTTSANKRPANCVPQLIDNKRKH